MKKIIIIICSIVISVPLVMFLCLLIPWLLIYAGIAMSPDPPEPAITHAEFPFEIVYKLDGETETINDVYVCEYDGIDMNEGIGKYLVWKGYVKSSGDEYPVFFESEEKLIFWSIGSPEYYMGGTKYEQEEGIAPFLILVERSGEFSCEHCVTDEEMKDLGIELVSWKFSEPIVNTFE